MGTKDKREETRDGNRSSFDDDIRFHRYVPISPDTQIEDTSAREAWEVVSDSDGGEGEIDGGCRKKKGGGVLKEGGYLLRFAERFCTLSISQRLVVLSLIARGGDVGRIAADCRVKKKTVYFHLKNIRQDDFFRPLVDSVFRGRLVDSWGKKGKTKEGVEGGRREVSSKTQYRKTVSEKSEVRNRPLKREKGFPKNEKMNRKVKGTGWMEAARPQCATPREKSD